MALDAKVVLFKDPCSHTKATFMGDYLAHLMNRLCHPQHQPNSDTLFISLLLSKLWRMIFPFMKFAMPNESCPKVSIVHGMIFIAKWVGFARSTHPPRAIVIEPYVHWFIKCIEETGWVLTCIIIIPPLMQLTNVDCGWLIHGLPSSAHTHCQIFSHCSRRACHPLFLVVLSGTIAAIWHSFEICHEESNPQPLNVFSKSHFVFSRQGVIYCGDESVLDVCQEGGHQKQSRLIIIGDSSPRMVDPPSFKWDIPAAFWWCIVGTL